MENPKVERRETGVYGLGVFALEDIKAGTVIATFDGVYYEAVSAMQLPNDPPLCAGRHAIQYSENRWRDGTVDGIARYIAHSCDPNCGIQNQFDIVAKRDIKAGEELKWDYGMSEDSDFLMKCLCGSQALCRGEVGAFHLLSVQEREQFVLRNKGFISQWLVDKYKLY